MSTFCPDCKGSGERGQYGVLDCDSPSCAAATDRAALETHLLALGPLSAYDREWEAYKLGQAKAQAALGPNAARYEWLRDSQNDPAQRRLANDALARGEWWEDQDRHIDAAMKASVAAPTNNSTESKTNDR